MPGGAAGPPATGMDEGRVGAVRELVRRLPWVEWAELRNPEFQLTPVDADLVQAAICAAMASAGITLDQAAAIGQAALGDATKTARPVGYVVDAFRKHLPRRLRALGVEPLSDNPLPLLGKPKRQVGPPSATTHEGEGAATADTDAGESAKPVLPACETCGAREGEGPSYRRVTGEDGREHPCPDCLPATA